MDQLPLKDIFVAAQVRTPHATGVIAVGKAAFHQFAPPAEQTPGGTDGTFVCVRGSTGLKSDSRADRLCAYLAA